MTTPIIQNLVTPWSDLVDPCRFPASSNGAEYKYSDGSWIYWYALWVDSTNDTAIHSWTHLPCLCCCCFCTVGAPPTLLKLKTMKGADGKPLKIIATIAACDYTTFGMCLLQDENGLAVALLKRNHIPDGAESVTEAILQKWLTSDAPTRSYQHLIECLRQSELGALAELIVATVVQG